MRLLLLYTGYVVGISFLMLLGLVVPIKYILTDSIAISLPFYGIAHSLLLAIYLVLIVLYCFMKHLPWHFMMTGALLSILPFGPFVFEKKLRRKMKISQYDQIFQQI